MKLLRNLLILLCFVVPIFSFASSAGHSGGAGGDDGSPGCDGGTDPAADGQFYTPDGVRCNPGPEDAEKTHGTS